jgi:hypothetical protein
MENKWCPLIRKKCVGDKCAWYTHIRGYNPNTGQDVDEWSCTISWLPMLMIENSQQQRSTSAAVESFRNEMIKSNESNLNILQAAANMFYGTAEMIEDNNYQVFENQNSTDFLPENNKEEK